MTYLNGITAVNNQVVTHLQQEMNMLFRINELSKKHEKKLRSLLSDHDYQGCFDLSIHDNKIMYVSYLTGYSDDWECYGVDQFAQFVEDCVNQL